MVIGITDGLNGEGAGESKEMFEDYIFHGGDVSVAADAIGAGDGDTRGCTGTEHIDFKLHVRKVLQFQGAFATICLQNFLDRYSSRFHSEISSHHMYVLSYYFPFNF